MKNWIEADWPVPPGIHAAVTLRSGGNSSAPYQGFNLAKHVNDKAEHVAANRKQLKASLQLPGDPVWLNQVHGDTVVKADQTDAGIEADAAYTDQANTVCAVMTADCLPVLMVSADGQRVAAIHAGWRGLLAGVIENTVIQMQAENGWAWLGPAICPRCFEVGAEVRVAFVQNNSAYTSAFSAQGVDNKYLMDIFQLARMKLQQLGVKQIFGGKDCTVCDRERFFSYRRDGETGRMASLIWRD